LMVSQNKVRLEVVISQVMQSFLANEIFT
jgi:hypothetical protein